MLRTLEVVSKETYQLSVSTGFTACNSHTWKYVWQSSLASVDLCTEVPVYAVLVGVAG